MKSQNQKADITPVYFLRPFFFLILVDFLIDCLLIKINYIIEKEFERWIL